MPFCRLSSMRWASERISFSSDSMARRGNASVTTLRISPSSERNAAIDCSIPLSGRCSASIWLVMCDNCRSIADALAAGAATAAGAIGGAFMRGTPSSSFWRAVISEIAKSSENGSIGGAVL